MLRSRWFHSAVLRSPIKRQSMRSLTQLSPQEAGKRAEALAVERSTSKRKVSMPTLVAHAGIENVHNAPLSAPLHVSTTYTRPADGIYHESDVAYAREDNPTRLLLEKTVFELETSGLDLGKAEFSGIKPSSCAFASGMMTASAVILAHSTPLTVFLPKDLYHGVPTLLIEVFSRHNVEVRRVDMAGPTNAIVDAINAVDSNSEVIVWMESPSNPLCEIIDIAAITNAVKGITSHVITTVVDVTLASPIVTRPLEFGADISMHSGTKYLAGHSDALLGVLTTSPVTERGRQLAPILKSVQIMGGGVASPWDSWLALRGIRTLQVRVERQSRTALALAEFLVNHEYVTAVHYPGLPLHPSHDVARSQMSTFGGVFSVELENEQAATAFAAALSTIKRATSLGGTETLIEHRASIEPPARRTSPPGLLRVSVGLEDVNDLIHDMTVALDIAMHVMAEQN